MWRGLARENVRPGVLKRRKARLKPAEIFDEADAAAKAARYEAPAWGAAGFSRASHRFSTACRRYFWSEYLKSPNPATAATATMDSSSNIGGVCFSGVAADLPWLAAMAWARALA